ncbi:MAG: hypothetical protein WDW38_001143 [Sanguina aurantia]
MFQPKETTPVVTSEVDASSSTSSEAAPGKREKFVPEERSTVDAILTAPSTANPEFPPYSVISKGPIYNLRLYDIYPIVEMNYERRGDGYASLGSYFDGQNSGLVKFAYTQPVFMRYEPDGRKSMAMFIGSRRGVGQGVEKLTGAVEQLPLPDDKQVRIGVAGAELVAVHIFEGNITPGSAEAARLRLVAALAADGIQLADDEAAGAFRCGQYGAVYQLGGRLNEMLLKVKM